MADTETHRAQVTFAQHNGRLNAVEKEVEQLNTQMNLIGDLRVDIGKLETQIKVTWGLLTMVVGGLLSVAFSIWKN